MKILAFVIALCVYTSVVNSQDIFTTELETCHLYENIVEDYRYAFYEFAAESYRNAINKRLGQFVFSPLSVWIDLAAIAEGADPATKLAMFQFLKLPIDPCVRLKYYQLATSRFVSGDDVHITNTRALVIDEGVTINPVYHNFVFKNCLLDVVSAPMRYDPQTALKEIRRVASANLPNLDLSGNSIILEAVDYNGLWSTAFEDAVVVRSPFYSKTGEQIGNVDLMKIRRRVRRSYFRTINVKAIEIPVGHNDRYRMIFGMIVDYNILRAISAITSTVVHDFLNSLEESSEPIDISIPRINITSEFDLRKTLEEFGVNNIWTDPYVTGYVRLDLYLQIGLYII